MHGGSGLALVAILLQRDPSLHVLMLTGHGSTATAVEAVRLGARNCLTRPTDTDMILAAFAGSDGHGTPRDYEPPSLAQAEWKHIQRVLENCRGNISHAAR